MKYTKNALESGMVRPLGFKLSTAGNLTPGIHLCRHGGPVARFPCSGRTGFAEKSSRGHRVAILVCLRRSFPTLPASMIANMR